MLMQITKGELIMAVYKRGTKGVFYMNFTVAGVRVTRSIGDSLRRKPSLLKLLRRKG